MRKNLRENLEYKVPSLVCCHASAISLEEVSRTKCSKWHEETIVKVEETDIVRNELYIKVSTVNSFQARRKLSCRGENLLFYRMLKNFGSLLDTA